MTIPQRVMGDGIAFRSKRQGLQVVTKLGTEPEGSDGHAISQPESWGRVTSSLKRGLFHNNPRREFLSPGVENHQPNRYLLEAVSAGRAG
jgi:hypothetical protein